MKNCTSKLFFIIPLKRLRKTFEENFWEIFKIWGSGLLPLLSYIKQIFRQGSAVAGCQTIELVSLIEKGILNQKWNSVLEVLFDQVNSKITPLFGLEFFRSVWSCSHHFLFAMLTIEITSCYIGIEVNV